MNARTIVILSLSLAGCARSAKPVTPPQAAITEPVFDTIGEFHSFDSKADAIASIPQE